jgi:hypothetical protein
MTAWTPDELARIHRADELRVASRRPDGTLRPAITIWVVRLNDEIYVRSAHGPDNPWYRRAVASGSGHIDAGGVSKDVDFAVPGTDLQAVLDAAYHAKYDRYGARTVGAVVGSIAASATLRVTPAQHD